MSTIELPEQAASLAAETARSRGMSLTEWLAQAISHQATRDEEAAGIELDVDDCGFPVVPAPTAAAR